MAGDHKCPICPATFTRPQHVGRHLRSHTGDRPYECKECTLRFARSDLLSRHVNKAHRAAEAGAEPKKESKKGRRKSLPSSARQATDENSGLGEGSGQATHHQVNNGGPAADDSTNEAARRASFSQAPHLQAQALFPHHPLLAGTPSPLFVNTAGVNGVMGSPVKTYHPSVLSGPAATVNGFNYSMASPMTWSNSDMGASSSSMTRNESSLSSYDYGLKKKACDQCNHSKQRCDFAHPCVRCTTRNLGCTYNKPVKSRTSSLTPGMPYQGMPVSMSPVSSFSMSPHTSTSPLTHQQGYPSQMTQYTTSPTAQVHYGLPGQLVQQPQLGVWTDGNNNNLTHIETSLGNSAGQTQALGMYLPTAPVAVQMQQQLPNANNVPIFQQYGQLPNGQATSPSLQIGMSSTPSLTPSHTTSPSSSDEPAERKPSLIESIAGMNYPGSLPIKSYSFSSDTSNHPIKPVSPDAKLFVLPPQTAFEQADLSAYQWDSASHTIDPRSQIRQPLSQPKDDAAGQGLNSADPIFDDADEPITVGRRRSSVGLWANVSQMTLQDGQVPPQALPDPYTAVQAAHQAATLRPTFPMTTVVEGSEPGRLPSFSDVREAWKQYIQDPNTGSTPKLENKEGESSVASTSSRPGLERGMSKSNSAPDLTSPSLLAKTFSYEHSNSAQAHAHAHGIQHGSFLPASDTASQTWQNQIQQRQAGFTMQPGGRFGRNSTGGATSMLPPPNNARPVASIMQHSGALQQTLAPERAPSFGLTPNTEKANPTNTLRTPSKLSQRTTVTSATARPGNKRLPSQTLVPEAKKRSSSFSVYDDSDAETFVDNGNGSWAGAMAGTGWNMASFQNMASGTVPLPGYATGHGRSASLSGLEGWDLSMFNIGAGSQAGAGYQPNGINPIHNMGAGVPAPMASNQ